MVLKKHINRRKLYSFITFKFTPQVFIENIYVLICCLWCGKHIYHHFLLDCTHNQANTH